MRLYENEAKKLFMVEDIPVPTLYGIITAPEGLVDFRGELKFPLMIKSMVLTGGRGKAGGIQKASSIAEAQAIATEIFSKRIHGYAVQAVALEEMVPTGSPCYIGIMMSPVDFNNVIMVSPSGGVNIEQMIKKGPENLLKVSLPENDLRLSPAIAHKLALFLKSSLKTGEKDLRAVARIIRRLYRLYQKYDCKVVEINPLIITPHGPVAVDAKVVLDDNGLFRQRRIFNLLDIKEARHDIAEPTSNEMRARKTGFPYVDLLPEDYEKDPDKLYVGLVPGGAGYGIFSIDEVINVGKRYFENRVVPVNFMDSGGGPTTEQVAEMFHLLMDYEVVDIILTSRFGGISSCDTFIQGIAQCLQQRREKKRRVPIYGRMVGTDLPRAREFLERVRRERPEDFKDVQVVVGNQKIMAEIIREGIQWAFQKKA